MSQYLWIRMNIVLSLPWTKLPKCKHLSMRLIGCLGFLNCLTCLLSLMFLNCFGIVKMMRHPSNLITFIDGKMMDEAFTIFYFYKLIRFTNDLTNKALFII